MARCRLAHRECEAKVRLLPVIQLGLKHGNILVSTLVAQDQLSVVIRFENGEVSRDLLEKHAIVEVKVPFAVLNLVRTENVFPAARLVHRLVARYNDDARHDGPGTPA